MRLTWDEIRRRAKDFAQQHADKCDERADAQLFVNDFFKIFGMSSRQIGRYERRVADVSMKQRGFIDFFWPGEIIVEMKSLGKSLAAAEKQALDYIDGVHPTERPRFVLACDFQHWRLVDLEEKRDLQFALADLPKHIEAFAFIHGRKVSFETQADVTIKAAELMGKLHDALEDAGYTGHALEQLLVRLLFCLFADDTGIFQPKDIFLQLLENDTRPDGSDTGRVLNELFDVLDTPDGDKGTTNQRQKGLPDELNRFPYVNGALFRGRLHTPVFSAQMRTHLLDAARHDWSGVSPAIFGSLFQSVMDAKERRAKGAHYTTEANILKVIGPLFLDDLKAELEAIKARKSGRDKELAKFQDKLTRLTFLDPACGCGNFLVVAYREIRRLELAALKAQYGDQQIDAALLSRVMVDQFYGIEYEEFPARIAEVAMWMMDHIANNEIIKAGQYVNHIATTLAGEVAQTAPLPPAGGAGGGPDPEPKPEPSATYPPLAPPASGRGIANHRIRIAFVSTNSICQGEQVAQLWPILFDRCGLEIAFAHRTFSWGSEARGKAHVHVVIVGLAHRDFEPAEKRLFSYPDIKGDPVESRHAALTAYLFDARGVANRHLVVVETTKPLSERPTIVFGNMPNDDGNLILSPAERFELIASYPQITPFIRPLYGAKDFIDGNSRYCLWLANADPAILRTVPPVMDRLKRNRAYRGASSRKTTKALANYPGLFGEVRHTEQPYILIPRHSSERREFVPYGFCPADSIAHDSCLFIPNATLYDFAILTSRSHMAWLGHMGGRLKSDFRYSIGLVYNTFPWPDATPAQQTKIEALAQAVLDARAAHPTSSLADLYDPDTMPANLRRAHAVLDLAVDRLYRAAPFASDRDRVEHLFGRYEALVNPLERLGAAKNKRVARKAAAKAE